MASGAPVYAYYSLGKPGGFVGDYAGVLSTESKTALEEKLSQFEKSTSNEISVVMIKSLQGDTIENFANKLFQEWGIGKKDKDNGILFVAAIDDRQMRIEVGYGLEGSLTDAQSYWILQNVVKPAFKDGDYNKGIGGAVDKIMGAISGSETVPSEKPNSPPSAGSGSAKRASNFNLALTIGSLMMVSYAGWFARSKSWWAGGMVGFVWGLIFIWLFGYLLEMIVAAILLTIFGLGFDYFVSRDAGNNKSFWLGGFFGGGDGGDSGGFGGFGGGSSGGGGSSSSW